MAYEMALYGLKSTTKMLTVNAEMSVKETLLVLREAGV
jgi:hypothetical protein